MKEATEKPDLDMRLVAEFEYRKKKLKLVEEGRKSIESLRAELQGEQDIQNIRNAAVTLAQHSIDLAIGNVDNAIVAMASARKYQSAIYAMQFLLLLLIFSNVLTAGVVWLILR